MIYIVYSQAMRRFTHLYVDILCEALFTIDNHGFDVNVGGNRTTVPRVYESTKHDTRRDGDSKIDKDCDQRHNENDQAIREPPVPQNCECTPLERAPTKNQARRGE